MCGLLIAIERAGLVHHKEGLSITALRTQLFEGAPPK